MALGIYGWVVIVLAPWVGFESHADPSVLDWTVGTMSLLLLLAGALVPSRLVSRESTVMDDPAALGPRIADVLWLLGFPLLLTFAAARHEPSASSTTETLVYVLLAASAVAGFVLRTAEDRRHNGAARETESRPHEGSLLSDAFRSRRRIAGAVALVGAALPAVLPLMLGDTIRAHWPGAEREATLLTVLVGAAAGAALLGHALGQVLRRHRRDQGLRESWTRALPWFLLSAVATMLCGVTHWLGQ